MDKDFINTLIAQEEEKQQKQDRLNMLSKKFYDQVMPQVSKLTFQNYEDVNELDILLREFTDEY